MLIFQWIWPLRLWFTHHRSQHFTAVMRHKMFWRRFPVTAASVRLKGINIRWSRMHRRAFAASLLMLHLLANWQRMSGRFHANKHIWPYTWPLTRPVVSSPKTWILTLATLISRPSSSVRLRSEYTLLSNLPEDNLVLHAHRVQHWHLMPCDWRQSPGDSAKFIHDPLSHSH